MTTATIVCTGCLEPCSAVEADFGIGHYEYWGALGYDSHKEIVSNCCEAPFITDEDPVPFVPTALAADDMPPF